LNKRTYFQENVLFYFHQQNIVDMMNPLPLIYWWKKRFDNFSENEKYICNHYFPNATVSLQNLMEPINPTSHLNWLTNRSLCFTSEFSNIRLRSGAQPGGAANKLQASSLQGRTQGGWG